MMQPFWKTVRQSLKQLSIELPYFLGIYPRERKIHIHTKFFMGMFTVALFIRVPNYKK